MCQLYFWCCAFIRFGIYSGFIFWEKIMDKKTALERVIEHFGGISLAARGLSTDTHPVDRQVIDRWRKLGFIPFKRGTQIEEATGGAVTALDVWTDAAQHNRYTKG